MDDKDTIYRQEAIDALLELVEARRTWINTENARKEISGIDASMCAIHDLPSAQPEIIRCKECVYADENYHCDYMTTWNDGDCFCCYGKRGTDG